MLSLLRTPLSSVLLLLSPVVVAQQCELHCVPMIGTPLLDCHSHNPFGGCTYVVEWMQGQAPQYDGANIRELSIYLGDLITFSQSSDDETDTEADTIVAIPTEEMFDNCVVQDSVSVVDTDALPSTVLFDTLNYYYYASRDGCADGAKLKVGVFTVDSGLECHDHVYPGQPGTVSCHCHTYEEILCPREEPDEYTLYDEHVSEVEMFCAGILDGSDAQCPFRCYQPMEVLHLHYLECPGRMKDATYEAVEATGLCHPAQRNNGNRDCPVVDVPLPVVRPVIGGPAANTPAEPATPIPPGTPGEPGTPAATPVNTTTPVVPEPVATEPAGEPVTTDPAAEPVITEAASTAAHDALATIFSLLVVNAAGIILMM